jgi:hypothetical protein
MGEAEFVDHEFTDQTSIMRFVEDNWLGGVIEFAFHRRNRSRCPARSSASTEMDSMITRSWIWLLERSYLAKCRTIIQYRQTGMRVFRMPRNL